MKTKIKSLLISLLIFVPCIMWAQDISYDTIKVELEGIAEKKSNTEQKPEKNNPYYLSVKDRELPIGRYTVSVRYIVTKQGLVSDVVAVSKCGYGMEDEVIRIIKKGPRWVPAEQHPINNTKTFHRKFVTFIVSHPGFDIRCNGQYVLTTDQPNTVTVTTTLCKLSRVRLKADGKKIKPNAQGQFIITPSVKPGERINIQLYKSGKKKKLGEASFEVKAAS